MMRKFLLYCTFCLLPVLASSQQISRYVFASGGGSLIANQNHFSFTMGESVVASFISNDSKYFQNQGFQQPASLIVNSINDNNSAGFDMLIYPNPTRDLLYLKSPNNNSLSNYLVYLYDILGNLQEVNLESVPGFAELSVINMTRQPKGTYLLKIIDTENSDIQFSFTIIKIY